MRGYIFVERVEEKKMIKKVNSNRGRGSQEFEKGKKKKKGESLMDVNSRGLQNPLDLGVVRPLDLLVVHKRLLLTDVPIDLEACLVEAVVPFAPTDVVHERRSRLCRSLVRLGLAYVGRMRGAAVAGIFVVVEIREDIVGGLYAFV